MSNNGPGAALGVVTVAELPSQLVLITSQPGAVRRQPRLAWTDPVLMPGSRVTYAVRLRAGAHAATTRLRLRAVVTALTTDPEAGNNSAALVIRIRTR